MKQPRGGGSIRKPTDTNQKHLDMLNPPVFPDMAKMDRSRFKNGPLQQKTMRVGKS
jgi:hypothetical protein